MGSKVVRMFASAWRGGLAAFFAFALIGTTAPALHAQTGQITGTVTNAQSSAGLGEVQVYIEGQQLGTLTRADGRFLILNVPAGSYELTAQRIGFGTQTQSVTVTAGSAAVVDFSMDTEALGLDEIVVTGTAGASRRREVGNTISQINIADVPDRPVSTSDLLQGQAPGIDIVGGGAEGGQGKQIRLRGNSSVSMTNNPIIYIDGIRMRSEPLPVVNSLDTGSGRGGRIAMSPLDNINPNEIERIEIIKGSAATTLYGTEASAGVIQIFTKRGASGAPVWTAEIQQGTGWSQQFGINGMDYLNMEHYMRDPWWGGGYEGGEGSVDCVVDGTADNPDQDGDQTQFNSRWEGVNSSPEGACSWPGAFWTQNYSLSVRGGGEALQYFVSGQFQNDSYLLPNDEQDKYAFRGNFTFTPVDNLSIQWNTGYINQWNQNTSTANNAQGVTLNAFRQERNYAATGDPRIIGQTLEYEVEQWVERLTTGMTLTYSPLSAMTNRLTVGYDFSQQEGRNLRNFGFNQFPRGSLTNDMFQNRLLTFDYVGTYNFDITETVGSTFSWGGQAVGDEDRRLRGYGEDFPGATEPTISQAAVTFSQEDRQKVWNAGFFFQNIFDISDKYFITAGLRVDGNSAFGTGFGLQAYPKVSGSWVISDEDFWTENLGSMKVRAAYGQSGRAPGAFDAVRTWEASGFAGIPAFTPDNLGSPDLGPEVTAEWEAGFDASWLQDRLTTTFTYYSQKTKDALMNVAPIQSQGFTSNQLQNVGQISNKGIELQIDGAVIQNADWGLDIGLGLSTNKSNVDSLCRDPADETTCIPEFDDLNGRIIEGQPVPVIYERRVANPDAVTGSFSLADYVNNGESVVVGPSLPTHFVTPSLALRVPGNIILSARGEYRGGHYAFVNPISIGRSARSALCFPYYGGPFGLAGDGYATLELKDDTPNIWRERCDPSFGEDYWFDADYFKLRSVSATIPMGFAFPDRISNATLTLALNNAWSWFREVPWYDVEVFGNDGAGDDGIGGSTERVPAPATFRMALRVTF
jgi:TonB-dependent starch-binding outer membrane protein SusC